MQHGDRIDVDNVLERKATYKGSNKYWLSVRKPHKKAIFLGWRTLSNGSRDYDYEGGWSYRPEQFFKAALISIDEKTKPVYSLVLDEQVEFNQHPTLPRFEFDTRNLLLK